MPSVVLGSSSGDGGPGGYYLYQSANGLNGPWTMTTIDPVGDAYERTRAFTWPGDTFPGFMASRSGQLVWYYNPMNWGGDPTQPWGYQVINPNAGCHDMRIVDVEQSGFPAVVCSSVFFGGTSDFIAFNNGAYNSWTIVDNPFNVTGAAIGDFVARYRYPAPRPPTSSARRQTGSTGSATLALSEATRGPASSG